MAAFTLAHPNPQCPAMASTDPSVTIRASRDADVAAIQSIYAHHVLHGTGTFELAPPDREEIGSRRAAVLALDLPWLVAEAEGRVIGYAYAAQFRARPAYRYFVEDSVYIAPEVVGRGVGRRLMNELIRQCEAAGCRQLLAVIGDSANVASIGLHAACGFRFAGILRSAGWKFERWVDVVMMQRELGAGDGEPPGSAGSRAA